MDSLNLLIPSLVGGDEPFRAGRPFERLRLLLVVQIHEVQKRPLEILDGIMNAAPEPALGQLPEEALDGVHPGAGGRRCNSRIKTPQKRRSKIPQLGGCEFVPRACPGTKAVQNPIRFFCRKRLEPGDQLLYLNHDIAFPSPTLAKADDGRVWTERQSASIWTGASRLQPIRRARLVIRVHPLESLGGRRIRQYG